MVTSSSISTEIVFGSIGLIHTIGEIDQSNLPDLESAVKLLLESPALKAVVINCTDITFINSKVVGYFAYLHTTLVKSGRKLVLAALNETLSDILALVGLTAIIPHYETWEEAVEKCKT